MFRYVSIILSWNRKQLGLKHYLFISSYFLTIKLDNVSSGHGEIALALEIGVLIMTSPSHRRHTSKLKNTSYIVYFQS